MGVWESRICGWREGGRGGDESCDTGEEGMHGRVEEQDLWVKETEKKVSRVRGRKSLEGKVGHKSPPLSQQTTRPPIHPSLPHFPSHLRTWLDRIGWGSSGKKASQISVALLSSKHPPPFVMKMKGTRLATFGLACDSTRYSNTGPAPGMGVPPRTSTPSMSNAMANGTT